MAVDNGTWDGAEAMSRCANADDPAAAYEAVCAGRREGDPELQSSWALPHHMSPMMGPNADGVRNALSRLPQTQGLTNEEAAQRHLEAHMAEVTANRTEDEHVHEDEPLEAVSIVVEDSDIEVRDAAKREIDARLVPWGVAIDTMQGREMFEAGAFDGTNPDDVLLMGLEHQARLGTGQAGQPTLARVPIGIATALSNRSDGQHATFRVAETPDGDEFMALAKLRAVRGISVEFNEVPGGTRVETVSGRRTRIYRQALLRGAAPTYRPAYREAEIVAVRSEPERAEREPEVTEVADQTAPAVDINAIIGALEARQSPMLDRLMGRLEAMEERARSEIVLPQATTTEAEPVITRGEWLGGVLRLMTGDRVDPALQRSIADVITSDNLGVVPPTYLTEVRGVIDRSRPFLESTRRLPTPATGLTMTVPVITQRPTTAKQTTEKTEVSSTATKITSNDFAATSIAGAGDISIQLLKRSSPSFLDLWLELLFEAYAIDCEDIALRALFDATGGGVTAASSLDPNNLALGAAFINSYDAIKRPPDTIWLSTEAVGEFIDAKASTTNQPLYSALRTEATAAGGISGQISGLRAVHVPALDSHGAFAVVGPSSGFAWAEDGTYTLQVDVPTKAGRDVGLIGMLWAIPWYPAAFTVYNVAS